MQNYLKDYFRRVRSELILIYSVSFLMMILFISGCSNGDKIKVGLSKGQGSAHYLNYEKWLKKYNQDIEFIDLYHIERAEALEILNDCSGIVLTGGPDVEPSRYGKAADSLRCEIDLMRDTLEFDLIEKAYELGIPILAICRGEQILNVAFGGTLIVDIPSDFDTTIIHRCEDPTNCMHEVVIVENSLLHKISGVSLGNVNSNHHQAVDELAEYFKPTAYSKDGLIEAFEWKEPKGKPFLQAVQWHPERLDSSNNLSYPIGKYFINQVLEFEKKREIFN